MNQESHLTPAVATLQPTPLRIKLKSVPVRDRPILEPGLLDKIEQIIIQYSEAAKWKEWGLDQLRDQGACALFEGPPGTGKTMAAKYLGRKLGRPMEYIDLGSFGSKEPGENERRIDAIFRNGNSQKKTLIFDECEALLADRSKLDSHAQWMISTIDKLLTGIGSYRWLILLITNMPQLLDPAIHRRLIARLQINRPTRPTRELIWKQKMPAKFPFQPTQAQFEALSAHDLSGANIETVILQCGQTAIWNKRVPNFDMMDEVCRSFVQP